MHTHRKRPSGANSAPLLRDDDMDMIHDRSPSPHDVDITHVRGVAHTHLGKLHPAVVKVCIHTYLHIHMPKWQDSSWRNTLVGSSPTQNTYMHTHIHTHIKQAIYEETKMK